MAKFSIMEPATTQSKEAIDSKHNLDTEVIIHLYEEKGEDCVQS